LTDLSKLYRKNNRLNDCLKLFTELPFTPPPKNLKKTFSFYSEFGTVLHKMKKFSEEIVVLGFALSDNADISEKWNNIDLKICLNRLSESFFKLYEITSNHNYGLAFLGTVKTGVEVSIEGKAEITHKNLLSKVNEVSKMTDTLKVFNPTNKDLTDFIIKGIKTASEEPMLDIPNFVKKGDEISFNSLESFINNSIVNQ
jgi:hypothetical protein